MCAAADDGRWWADAEGGNHGMWVGAAAVQHVPCVHVRRHHPNGCAVRLERLHSGTSAHRYIARPFTVGHRPLALSAEPRKQPNSPRNLPTTAHPLTGSWMCAASQGIIQSSFLWGYAAMQLLGGTLADRFGGKIVMSAGIVIFTSACAALPFTVAAVQAGAVRHPSALYRCRSICLGLVASASGSRR